MWHLPRKKEEKGDFASLCKWQIGMEFQGWAEDEVRRAKREKKRKKPGGGDAATATCAKQLALSVIGLMVQGVCMSASNDESQIWTLYPEGGFLAQESNKKTPAFIQNPIVRFCHSGGGRV